MIEHRGAQPEQLPAPVQIAAERLLSRIPDVHWTDISAHPFGAGRWKRPLTYVRFCHGDQHDVSHYWLRDDTGGVVGSGTAR